MDSSSLETRSSPLGAYRVRGVTPSRLEAFSDAVFGFSATLLVVSLEVPASFAELTASLRGFGAFGLSFLALVFIWLAHRGFFRRYGLNDPWVTSLNMILLFVILFFVYPLKFLSVTFVEQYLGLSSQNPTSEPLKRFSSLDEVNALFVIYGLGFGAVFLCFALLYRRAIAQRESLQLDAREVFQAKSIFWYYMIMVAVALLSVGLAAANLGGMLYGIAGWIYGSLGPIMYLYWGARERALEKIQP